MRELATQVARDARNRATGSHARDDDVHFPTRVGPDLRTRGRLMNSGIGGIFKLPWHPGIGRVPEQFVGLTNGTRPAFRGWREHEISTQAAEQSTSFVAHRVGNRQCQAITFRGGHKRQRDAGVPTGGLDNVAAFGQFARLLRRLNHRAPDAVLHARQGIEELTLDEHLPMVLRNNSIEPDQGRVTDGTQDVREGDSARHDSSSHLQLIRTHPGHVAWVSGFMRVSSRLPSGGAPDHPRQCYLVERSASSLPPRVTSCANSCMWISAAIIRTDPSPSTTFAPPEWNAYVSPVPSVP